MSFSENRFPLFRDMRLLPGESAWHRRVALGLLFARLAVAVALLPFAIDWRSPVLASLRPAALGVLVAVPLLLIGIDGWLLRRPQGLLLRALRVAVLVVAGATLIATLSLEARFHWVRGRVLAADTARLEKLGRHFVVGYRDPAEVAELIERRAIGGVFVGARNVEGLSTEAIRGQIEAWQDTRRRQGLPPLLIATDQEGGAVSRLSPPLPRQPPIASLVAQHADEAARGSAAHDYGLTQGRALASIGINLNFAPVVDLNKHLVNPNDRYTRIRDRAIASVPVPTFVSLCSRHFYERRNQRDTSQLYDSSVALDLTFLRRTSHKTGRNVKSATLAIPQSSPRSPATIAAASRRPACTARSSISPGSAACSRTPISKPATCAPRSTSSPAATGFHSAR